MTALITTISVITVGTFLLWKITGKKLWKNLLIVEIVIAATIVLTKIASWLAALAFGGAVVSGVIYYILPDTLRENVVNAFKFIWELGGKITAIQK